MGNKSQMRKFVREYIANYPSVNKIYDAIAGSRRMGSEITVSNYVRAVAKFTEYLGFLVQKQQFNPCSKEKPMVELRLTHLLIML